jgi:Fur family transcriptional regulator, ferric uptake regulator
MAERGTKGRRQPLNRDWVDHALAGLAEAGYQKGAARRAVIECLGREACAVSAQEIEDELRGAGPGVGRASIYRTLDQLEQLGLVHRLDLGTGVATYEPAGPSGEHHHHLLCDRCGRVFPFHDANLERTITDLARRSDFDVSAHDVTLHGLCPRCS